MRHSLFFAILFFAMSNVFAQTEKEAYKAALRQFQQQYNQKKFEAIFHQFSPEMKKAMPLSKTIDFLNGLFEQAGKLKAYSFINRKSGFEIYKAGFEKGILSFQIALDNEDDIAGLLLQPYVPEDLPHIERNTTHLILPFKDVWTVVWGGDTKEQNYHVESRAQKNAFDMVIMDATGKSHRNNGKTNEDYYAFGKELFAPCDGEIVLVVDGIKDNTPGESNTMYVPGNSVIIKTANNEYLFFAHFKQYSIKVKQGDQVKQDQLLGLCGNSGNSSEPHLHFHIQNVENINIATGVKCYFDHLTVNGQPKNDYSPVKGDKLGR
ncbi:MAG: peptidase M23 [Sphingobacteriales bacterium 44-61]|nr:MAG: peptidase M23 [Sphingobacteriales bacterium 44-61]